MIGKIARNLDQSGWFWLSFIDWALEWGENSRRERNSKNKFEHYKFVLSKIISRYSHEKTYTSRYESHYYVDFTHWLRDIDPEDVYKRQEVKDLFGLKNLTSAELMYYMIHFPFEKTPFNPVLRTANKLERLYRKPFNLKLLEKVDEELCNTSLFKELTSLQKICDINDLDYDWIEDNQIIHDFKFSSGGYTFLEQFENLNLLSFCIDVLKVDDAKIIENFEQNELHQFIRDLWNGSRV